jgi:hypothetical protein
LDCQFRGEIRGVQMFGSRVTGHGTLNAEEISSHLTIAASDTHQGKKLTFVDGCGDPPSMPIASASTGVAAKVDLGFIGLVTGDA